MDELPEHSSWDHSRFLFPNCQPAYNLNTEMNRSLYHDHQREIWLNRPTSDHFARVVADLSELAPAWQTAVQAGLRPDESIHLLVSVPFQGKLGRNQRKISQFFQLSRAWEFTPDWLIGLTEKRLLLVRNLESGAAFQTISIDLESILEIQCGTVLLFAWFNVQWAESGRVRQESVLFNAVGEPIFTRLIAEIRCSLGLPSQFVRDPDEHSRNLLQALPYKFMNILPKRSLCSGEPVRNLLYRPAHWKRWLGFFRRMTAAQAVVVLTPNAVMVAEEDCAAGQSQYGFIHTVYPLRLIRRAWVTQTEDISSLIFSIEQQRATIVKQIDFAPEANETLAAFANQIVGK
jgi:hypothetical protein